MLFQVFRRDFESIVPVIISPHKLVSRIGQKCFLRSLGYRIVRIVTLGEFQYLFLILLDSFHSSYVKSLASCMGSLAYH